MKLIAQGAEGKIHEENGSIIKERFSKKYRIGEIDNKLRKQRTRREGKVIERIAALGFGPKLIKADDKSMNIKMELIPGKKVRDVLDKDPKMCIEIGKKLAIMHDAGIIHGDLTTSNMIFDNKKKMIFFIDFGLSFFSEKSEDKAVDIHLFKEALESAHYKIEKRAYSYFLKGYSHSKNHKDILARLEIVEQRGRNKKKSGS